MDTTNFEIRRAKNGWILKVTANYFDEAEEIVAVDAEDEVEAFAYFLRELTDMYGPQRNNYSDRQIWVDIRAGRKYEAEATYAGVKVIADEKIDEEFMKNYGYSFHKEIVFFKMHKIPMDHLSVTSGVVKGIPEGKLGRG